MRVPVFCTSTLKAIAQNDKVGVYGNGNTEPVNIRYLFLAGFGYYLLWIVLLPLFLLKNNRKKAAWLILLVVISLHFLMILLQQWNPGGMFRLFNLIVHPVATGLGLVWLIGGMLKPVRRLWNGAVVIICLLLTGIMGLACYHEWKFEWILMLERAGYGFEPSWLFMLVETCVFFGFIGLVLTLGARIADTLCKKPVQRIHYAAWLAACDTVLFFVGISVLLVLIKVFNLWPDWLMKQFLPRCWKPTLVFGAAAGLALFLVQLPFILLSRVSPFFTERYKAIFGVELGKTEPKRK